MEIGLARDDGFGVNWAVALDFVSRPFSLSWFLNLAHGERRIEG
jgi:hypothetical protein